MKAAVVDLSVSYAEVRCKHSTETHAYLPPDDAAAHVPGAREQSVARILAAVNTSIAALDAGLVAACTGVAIAGQMHGVVLWHSSDMTRCSRLITWEDARADAQLLRDFNARLSTAAASPMAAPVHAGYGWVTLAALWRGSHPWVCGREAFDRAGTIGAYLAAGLAGVGQAPVALTASHAASWGAYDLAARRWERWVVDGVAP